MKTQAEISGQRFRCLAWALAIACGSARAGRPLGTEDTGTNAQAQCQLEGWIDSVHHARASHLAPACGLLDGLELGFEMVVATPAEEQSQARAVSVKWAPEWLAWQGWRFGAKAGSGTEKLAEDADWHQADWSVLAIASRPLSERWTLHLNLGHQRETPANTGATLYGAGLVWAPNEHWLAFGELTGDNKSPATQTIGMRWWIQPERLGLDLTTSRSNATPDSESWGIGIGWYSIRF